MDAARLRDLLKRVHEGTVGVDEAVEELRVLPFLELGPATLDTHRALRQGFPEVILCQGKTVEQIATIARANLERHPTLLATRATPEAFEAIRALEPEARYNPLGRTVVVRRQPPPPAGGRVLILTAGTADIPVAEEAGETAAILGSRVERLYDVGVAGIHRLLDRVAELREARVLIVAAGMDGVLPAVVGGLVDRPVIAVPTSVGYGASFGGLAALLTMLNSCAAGVAVVNIDNGFGAGVLAHRINLPGGEGR